MPTVYTGSNPSSPGFLRGRKNEKEQEHYPIFLHISTESINVTGIHQFFLQSFKQSKLQTTVKRNQFVFIVLSFPLFGLIPRNQFHIAKVLEIFLAMDSFLNRIPRYQKDKLATALFEGRVEGCTQAPEPPSESLPESALLFGISLSEAGSLCFCTLGFLPRTGCQSH